MEQYMILRYDTYFELTELTQKFRVGEIVSADASHIIPFGLWYGEEIGLGDVIADRVNVIPGGHDVPEGLSVDHPVIVDQLDMAEARPIHLITAAHKQSIGENGVVVLHFERRAVTLHSRYTDTIWLRFQLLVVFFLNV